MTTEADNPLIAQREDSTKWYTGIGVAESVADIHDAISSGSWVDGGLAVLGAGMEAVSLAVDPLGTLASYGVGFLMEHVEPLQEALDWVAGDPDTVQAYAKTWENVSTHIKQVADDHKKSVDQDVADWVGSAGDAYRTHAAETNSLLTAASNAASAASSAIAMAGGVVAFVRQTVRDLIAQAVGRLAAWAAEEVCTLGVATPLVAAQATTFVAKVLTTIAKLFRKLASTFKKLTPLLHKLKGAWEDIMKALKRGRGGTHVDGAKPHTKTGPADTHPSSHKPDSPNEPGKPHDDGTDTHSTSYDGSGDPDDGATGKPKNDPHQQADKDQGSGTHAAESGPENSRTEKQVTGCGDPVDGATGEFLLPETDLELPSVLPLVLGRRHRSDYRFGRWFGPSWSATLDIRIVVESATVTFIGDDGIMLAYPHTEPDTPVLPLNGELRWPLVRTETGGYRVTDPDRELSWCFEPEAALDGLDVRLGNFAISAIVDRHHNLIRFHYDSDGSPVEISHSGGYRVRVETEAGRVTGLSAVGRSHVDSDEIVTRVRTFVYEAGALVGVTNGVGATTTYTYDSEQRMTSWTDSNGNSLTNTYDPAGRVVRQRGTNGILDADFDYFTYPDGSGTRTTVTDSTGAATIYDFDPDHKLRDVIDPLGGRIHTDYTPDRKPLRVIAPNGGITYYTYTPDGDLAKVVRPDEKSISIDYAARNRPTVVTDADGSTRRQEWDAHGNVAATVDEAGRRTTFDHSPTGAVTSVTETTGATTTFEVDAAGLPVAVTDSYGAVTHIERDHFGRPVAVTDALGGITRHEWSPEGKPLRRIDPDGYSESWTWDGEGNLLTHTDRAGNITFHKYGAFDLLTYRTDPDGTSTVYNWDTERRLTTVTNPLGDSWSYSYDRAGRLTAETDYNGATTAYEYNPDGTLAVVTTPTDVRRYHTHDILGRLTQIRCDTGEYQLYTHDEVGRLRTAISGVGHDRTHTVEFAYDPAGNLVSQRVDDRPPMRFEHDEHGRRTSRRTPTGAVTSWGYDPAGRVTSMTIDGHRATFAHDALGRPTGWSLGNLVVEQTLSPVGQVLSRQVSARAPHVPGSAGPLTSDPTGAQYPGAIPGQRPGGAPVPGQHTSGGAPMPGQHPHSAPIPGQHLSGGPMPGHRPGDASVSYSGGTPGSGTPPVPTPGPLIRRDDYTWRPDGYLTTQTTHRAGTTPQHRTYTLDPAGRITTITDNGRPTEHYTYDALSNITSTLPPPTTPAPLPTNHAPDASTPVPGQTPDSRREYRNNLLIRNGRTRYFYDAAGRLIRKEVTRLSRKPDIWHFRYNGFDQLTDVYTPGKEWWRYTYDALGRRVSKLHVTPDGGGIVERTNYSWDSSHLVEQSAPNTSTHWSYLPGTYTPLTQRVDDRLTVLNTDLVGKPTELLDPVSGHPLAIARSNLWGHVSWDGTAETDLRFAGQFADDESGLHYNHHRYYDPCIARYVTIDPLGLPAAPNPNTYPHNPLTWHDPLGLACRPSDSEIQKMRESGLAQFDERSTNVGRALQKKLGRAGEKDFWQEYTPASGKIEDRNAAGARALNDFLTNGTYTVEQGRHIGVYQDLHTFRSASGIGARFTMDGTFVGFVT
ncbi:DUF6531 domain-containing protein [Nocardia aobensis]|uniref:DUF6531 domain-containing protein n=1 Tax=Nocardia aobensis TaxID=257277 RepID=A0ABW6PBV9_9NOCA